MRPVLRRRYFLVLLLLAAVAVGWVTYRVMHPPWEGTEAWENCEQIRLGMTEKDVEAVFGGRAPDWGTVSSSQWDTVDGSFCVTLDQFRHVQLKLTVIQGTGFWDPDERTWWDCWRARLVL